VGAGCWNDWTSAAFRPATPCDAPVAAELITRSEQSAGVERVLTAEQLLADCNGTTTSLPDDTHLAEMPVTYELEVG